MIAAIDGAGVWRLPILLALYTGMRRGEVLGLQWQDYNKEAKTLAICRAVSEYAGPITIKSTKTDRARVVLIPAALAEAIDEHAKTAAYTAPTDFICISKNGKPLSPKRFSKAFSKLATADGVKLSITLHGLRHSHATMLIAAGVPVKVVSERLGHADVGITQNIYAHVLPHMQQQAVDVLNGLQPGVNATEKPPENGPSENDG